MKEYNNQSLPNDTLSIFCDEYRQRFRDFCLQVNCRNWSKYYKTMYEFYGNDEMGNPEHDAIEWMEDNKR